MTDSAHVLVSSAGRRVALLDLFRAALAALHVRGKVLATDAADLAAAVHTADGAFRVPPCADPRWLPAVVDLCSAEGVRLLVPTIDPELPALAAHRDELARAGTLVAVSSPETVEIAADKERTSAWLADRGFPAVAQARVTDVLASPDGWRFPSVVKPRWGSASAGVTVVDDLEALAVAGRETDRLVQEVAPGIEYTVDLFVDLGGRCAAAVPRERVEVRAGEVTKAVTVRHPALQALARDVVEALPGAFGPLCVQMFLDHAAGDVRVVEINARFGGGVPLTVAAGADLPRWLLEAALGLPSTAGDEWRDGLVMLRYDEAVFVER